MKFNFKLFRVFSLFLIAFSNTAFAENEYAGKAVAVSQDAFANNQRLELNDFVRNGDVLTTSAESRLHIRMIDDTVLMLGANAHFQIDELAYTTTKAHASFTILSGAFRMISGKLTKRTNPQMTLSTPIATIGIRGTDFWGIIEEDRLSIALLDQSEISILLQTGPIILNKPMTLLQFEKGDTLPSLTPLSKEELEQAVKTVSLPN